MPPSDYERQHDKPVSTGTETVDEGTQSEPDSLVLELKLQNIILQRENTKLKSTLEEQQQATQDKEQQQATQDRPPFGVDDVRNNDKKCRFYTGLSWLQFMCLWNFLGPAREKLSYWNHQPVKDASPSKRAGVKRKLSAMNECFLTLVRLRVGLLSMDIAYRFNVPNSCVSKMVTTWIQFMYLQFGVLRERMFVSREIAKLHMPSCFRKFKGIRVIIDCSEFFVQKASHFARQGNMYSSYKNHSTYKCLIGVAPNGAITYISQCFEGSISDNEIVKQSGFLDKLAPGDLIMADRGFTIRDILMNKKVDLNIPPFLNGRAHFTATEEINTRRIARVRIHVERAIGRLKNYRMLRNIIPLSLQPVFSQMVFVAGCLVNFQEPIVK